MFSFENWIIQFAGKPKASKNDYKDKSTNFGNVLLVFCC